MAVVRTVLTSSALRRLRYPATAAFSALAIWLLLRSVDFRLMAQMLGHAQLIYLLPIAAGFLLRYWLRAVRWQGLVRHLRHIPLGRSYDRVIICQAADRVLPSQLGYPVTVQIAAAKFQIHHFQLFGTDLVERLMDAAVYAIFLALALCTLRIGAAFTGITAFLIGGTLTGISLAWWFTRHAAERQVPAHWPFARLLQQFLQGMESIQHPRRTAYIFGVSLAIWCTEVALYLMVALALGIHVNPLVYFLLVAAANTGAAVPLAQAAVGFVFVAQQVLIHTGHTASVAATYAVTLEALLIVSILLLAPASAYRLRLHLRDFIPHRMPAPPASATL